MAQFPLFRLNPVLFKYKTFVYYNRYGHIGKRIYYILFLLVSPGAHKMSVLGNRLGGYTDFTLFLRTSSKYDLKYTKYY